MYRITVCLHHLKKRKSLRRRKKKKICGNANHAARRITGLTSPAQAARLSKASIFRQVTGMRVQDTATALETANLT